MSPLENVIAPRILDCSWESEIRVGQRCGKKVEDEVKWSKGVGEQVGVWSDVVLELGNLLHLGCTKNILLWKLFEWVRSF